MSRETEDHEKEIESFHLLWDRFPDKVRLIRKDRTVVAVNQYAERIGMKTGVRCAETGPGKAHDGCLANMALEEKTAKHIFFVDDNRIRFWIPVTGSEELYVHFSFSIAEYIKGV